MKYLPILVLFGSFSDRQEGRQSVGQEGGQRAERMGEAWQECRRAGMQADRRMYRKTNVQIYIHVHTYRNKDVQTYADEQTDRQCRSAGRQTELTFSSLWRSRNFPFLLALLNLRKVRSRP